MKGWLLMVALSVFVVGYVAFEGWQATRPTLDRAQAAFEADDSWEQGRGYNWPAFHIASSDSAELHCKDSPDKALRWCVLQTLRIDPLDGTPLGVMPEEFVCSTSGCFWLEHFR